MWVLYSVMALFLLLTLMAGLWRVLRGPTAADRMLAAQLFGTTAVGGDRRCLCATRLGGRGTETCR